jgi:hypothetical protein
MNVQFPVDVVEMYFDRAFLQAEASGNQFIGKTGAS